VKTYKDYLVEQMLDTEFANEFRRGQKTIEPVEPIIEVFRNIIERLYKHHPTGCGDSFGEILCYEIHSGDQHEFLDYDEVMAKNGVRTGCDFKHLAKKWEIPVSFLGELILDHCRRL